MWLESVGKYSKKPTCEKIGFKNVTLHMEGHSKEKYKVFSDNP
jgi:hypothetical protein